MNKKKKKKHWTTKNRHIKRLKKKDYVEQPINRFYKICLDVGTWMIIIAGLLFIILKALDNRVVGYDHFPSIPLEWIKFLK